MNPSVAWSNWFVSWGMTNTWSSTLKLLKHKEAAVN